MTDTPFIVTDAATWLARGRLPSEAVALAAAWRDHPDLPPEAPLADRMERTRQRIHAMRPIIEAAQHRTEQERQARNFAFTAERCAHGQGASREAAILRARDHHGHDWDGAVRYADGWFAATAGWAYQPPVGRSPRRAAGDRAAYDQGFRDGGGDPADLFDAARRSLAVGCAPAAPPAPALARPLPSSWRKPTDDARPAPWSRRLALLSEHDPAFDGPTPGSIPRSLAVREEIRRRSGGAATIILLSAEQGFIPADQAAAFPGPLTAERADRLIADVGQRARLRRLVGGDYDDLLVAAQGEHLRVVDAFADTLPLCRCMERTRNTPLQQRAHLALWIDRAAPADGNGGAGHIRWGKAAKGLTAKLGEFTARYAGLDGPRQHRIVIELAGGEAAHGFAVGDGSILAPEVIFTSKARLRVEMAAALRRFGGATRLAAALRPPRETAM